ncbi:TonB-dependent receptor [Woodsholea maritima]|uniref:TonB-dependent receptor n=1 Tax=Woodsholea maritima TaxID=240237 RepID=UPI0003675CC5|nr:TonB-dependent receptor [Woodsholea maritima]
MKSTLYLSAAMGVIVCAAPAFAQTQGEGEVEVIRVLGRIAQGEQAAINQQRQADNIVNVVSSEGIGKLPDRNAAEAVQRVPGVSIERDQGEGRFVAVRGLPSQWSSMSINGNRLPTAEEETTSRATAFDFFPTEMIERVEVSKAVTPAMEGDAIGGNVNFVTRTAPSQRVLDVTVGAGFNDKIDGQTSEMLNVYFGDVTADERFGFVVNATYWSRDWATDNVEPRRVGDGGIRRLELRDYTGNRTTTGLNFGAEFNADANNRFYINGLYGSLNDDEVHYKHRYRFDKDRVEVQNIHSEMITRMWGVELGGEHDFGGFGEVDWSLSTYDNQFEYGDIPGGGENAYFVMRFDQKNVGYVGLGKTDGTGGNYVYNEIDGGSDDPLAISTHLPAGFAHDPAAMKIANVELYKVDVNERDPIVAQLNWTYHFNSQFQLQSGLHYRTKERTAVFADEFYYWNDAFGPAPTLADFTTISQPSRDGYLDGDQSIGDRYQKDFSPVVPIDEISAWWRDNKQKFTLAETADESALVSNGGALGRNFDVEEDHLSVYTMGTYTGIERLTLVGGVRVTRTETTVSGQDCDFNNTTLVCDSLTPVSRTKDYTSVLPSIHATYEINDNTQIRGAISRTFARPDFGTLTPGGVYAEHDNEYVAGNPNLNPTYSINYDLSLEHYFDGFGMVSGGVFYKDITDPIFVSTTTGTYGGNTGVDFRLPQNGGDAWLYGLELNVQRQLDFLPGLLSNLGVSANYTYMQSEMTLEGRADNPAIPRQANNLGNIAVYYEDDRLSARIAMNYKGEYIEEHGDDADSDGFYGDYTSVDFSASYDVTEQLQVYMDLYNLSGSTLKYFIGDEARPYQLEYYGMRGMFGLRYSFF